MCRNQEVKTECFERHESCQWNYASPVLTSSMTFSFPSCLSLPSFEEWPTASNLHSKASDLQIHKENMNFRFQVRVRFQVLVRVLQRNERNRTNCICLSVCVFCIHSHMMHNVFFNSVFHTQATKLPRNSFLSLYSSPWLTCGSLCVSTCKTSVMFERNLKTVELTVEI